MRLLIVEQDEMMRLYFERTLALQGHDVIVTASRKEALEMARMGPFDLTFVDANSFLQNPLNKATILLT